MKFKKQNIKKTTNPHKYKHNNNVNPHNNAIAINNILINFYFLKCPYYKFQLTFGSLNKDIKPESSFICPKQLQIKSTY